MSGDLGRYQRMADRAAERERARRARQEAEAAERAAGGLPGEGAPETEGEHRGHRTHTHGAHVGVVMCSCGAVVGGYSYVLPDDFDPPDRCPICDAHTAAGSPFDLGPETL